MQLNRLKILFVIAVAVTLIIGLISTASATNGYFAHGYSVKNKAMAGAGTALALDSLAASTNPAAMFFVGKRVDAGITFFNPNRQYTVKGAASAPAGLSGPYSLKPGTFKSDSRLFVIPSFGVNLMYGDYSLGVSVYGNGGMNTDYDESTYVNAVPGRSPTGVDLSQLFIVPTYARKLTEKHAFGISPVFAYQRFDAQGLDTFAAFGVSHDPENLTNNGHESSYGIGGRIGYLGEIFPGFFVGASYQTRIYMSEFDKYAGLFAEDGDFDIPSNWSAGIAYHATPDLTLAFDYQQIYYSEIDSVGNPYRLFNSCFGGVMMGSPAASIAQCLGGDKGVGFGWDDMSVVKFGIEWKSSPEWTWRAGYSYGDQPIDSSEVLFNILAPGVIEQHATAGFTKKMGDNQEVHVALMHAFANDISGQNPLDTNQTIELEMNQWELSLGYTRTF